VDKLKVVPLRIAVTVPQFESQETNTIRLEATSTNYDALDPGLFAVPEDFAKVDPPKPKTARGPGGGGS
jgi:hypothetical protein